jgi:Spy/CpxP family protein refolding chaperone
MKTFGKPALVLGAIALLAGPARAQPAGTYGPGRGMGGFVMLRNKSVQQELKATPEQARKLDALFDDLLAKGQKDAAQLNGLPQKDRRPKFLELQRARREDLHKGLDGILKPEQIKRFDQIDVQQAGVDAFEMPRVEEALKLTDEQKVRFRLIGQNMRDSLLGAIGDFKEVKKDPQAAMGKAIEAQARALAECLAALTEGQKATWDDLTGEPFVIVVGP